VINGILGEIEQNIELERIVIMFDNAEPELITQETEDVDVLEELTVVLVEVEVEVEEVDSVKAIPRENHLCKYRRGNMIK
jgi:hypothetical protein